MEVTEVRCVRREGTLTAIDADAFYESTVARPVDAYPEFGPGAEFEGDVGGIFPRVEDGALAVSNLFLEVDTDAGITGLVGPVGDTAAALALGFADLLVGRDPLGTEKIWDLLYRGQVHGRKGAAMMAISAIDCALWDVRGKHYGEPVHRLLGGPTRAELPAYASMFTFSTAPADVREAAAEMQDRGYGAQKWFFQHGPGSGEDGKERNVALAEAARGAVGEGYDLMFDCWMAWGRSYALGMIDRLAPLDPAWLEEPVPPDAIDQYAELRERAPFPVAGGEHEYTRWGFGELLDRDAVDVAQPDTLWAGGISELEKIFALASVHDVPVIPHGVSVPANVQVSAAQPPTACPLVEYLVRPNEALQFFFEDPIRPEGGTIEVPDRPGLGVSIDASKVETETRVENP